MRYLSVCAGIEAATVAWHDLGWEAAAYSEIEPFPSGVLAHHYPTVPNVGDMTKFKEWDIGSINLLVGGTPCQSFSIAGLRKGLDDPRGNLMLTYLAIADKYRPRWLVWENVPGVLSSGGGGDFATFLGALGELGYGFAYRILDAQYFGVAQRRRRVFVIGCLGDWRSAAAVLFERHSLSGHPAPSRKKGQKVAGTIAARFGNSRNNHEECVAQTLQARAGQGGFDLETETPIIMSTLCASDATKWGSNQWVDEGKAVLHSIALAENTIGRQPQNGGNGDGFTVGGPMYTLNATGVHGVAHTPVLMDQGGSVMSVLEDGTVGTLRRETHGHEPVVMQQMAVRRLTPVECERLQGFPDNYTNISWRKKEESPDGPRYKALGNSMAVPVMAWIGRRIADAS
jgi:DNA (cytosine-5)-methyltransferase 1